MDMKFLAVGTDVDLDQVWSEKSVERVSGNDSAGSGIGHELGK